MVVTALQRFSSRSKSFQSHRPEDLPASQHARNMSDPFSAPKVNEHVLQDDPTDSPSWRPNNGPLSPSLPNSPSPPPMEPHTMAPPLSPGMMSRSTSLSTSSSFQEDWDAFPPLDRITVFDLLDNMALPKHLEKWSNKLSAQTDRVRRQREKLKNSSLNAKERVVEEWRRRLPAPDSQQLEHYKKRMRDSVDRLGARWNDTKAVTIREKVAFIAGVLNIFISGYLIGAKPEYFYMWFTSQLCYFMPIRWYTYHKRGYHYFLADLCYFVNALLLLSLWVAPNSKRLFISTYCLAYGNNAIAIAMWRNSMVFHSMDKVVSLFIHIMPPVTLHCMVHLTSPEYQKQRFPAVYNIIHSTPSSPEHYNLWAMMAWATIPYAVWQLSYHFLITVRRREKIAAGRPTSFTWLRRSYAKTAVGKMILAAPPQLQEPMFMMVQYVYAILTMTPCPIWFWYRWTSATFLMAVFMWSIYNGATYYIDVFGKRFQNELELLKKDVAKWQTSPDIASAVATPLLETEINLTPQPRPTSLNLANGGLEGIPLLDSNNAGLMTLEAQAAENSTNGKKVH